MNNEQILEYRQKLTDKKYMDNAINKIVETGTIFVKKIKENNYKKKKEKNTESVQELNNIVAKNIIFYRKLKGMTQFKLAEKMEMTVNAINDWETGRKFLRANNLFNLSLVLDVEPWQLYYPGKYKSTQKIKQDLNDIKEQLNDIKMFFNT